MKMNTKMMAFVVAMAFAVVAFGVLTTDGSDADTGDVYTDEAKGTQYTVTGEGTVKFGAISAVDLTGELVIPANIYVDAEGAISYVAGEGLIAYAVTELNNIQKAKITAVTIPATVKTMAINQFCDCADLATITFLTDESGQVAFKVIPTGFAARTAITQIDIPSGVTEIGQSAFQSCSKLDTVSTPETLTTLGISAFTDAAITSIDLDHLISMGTAALANTAITEFTWPAGVTAIPQQALQGTKITSFTIPATVTTIGEKAFYNCTELESLSFADGSAITTIPKSFADGATKLSSITIPATVTTIGEFAFQSCTGLESLSFADGSAITTIPKAFANGATKLSSITLPQTVTDIGDNAFSKALISEFDFSHITKIGAASFGGTKLTNVIIPASVTTIGLNAFMNCSLLESFTIAEDSKLTIIPTGFVANTPITSFVVPDSVTEIQASAFRNCTQLNDITLGSSVASIGEQAFFRAPLKTITVNSEVALPETGSIGPNSLPGFTGYFPEVTTTLAPGIYKALYTPETYKVTVNVTASGEFWAKSESVINFGTSGTPLEMYLEAGEQQITLSSMGYQSKTVTVNVNEEGTASVTETLTADDTNIALDRTAQSIQEALEAGKKTIYIRTNSDQSEIVEVAEAGTEIIIERTLDGEDIAFSGNFTFGTSSIELYNVKFDAAGEFISIKSGSIELYGDIFDGVVVLSGDVKLVGDVNLDDGVTIVFKEGSTLDTNGYMFNFFGMPSVQTSSATVTEEVLATYGFESFISVDPIGEKPITTIFAVDGDKYLDITIENPIGTEATTDYAGYYIGKWTLVNAEQNAVYYSGSNGALPAGADKMYLNLGDVPNGNYLLTIAFMKNDGEAVAVSVDKPVSIYQGIILGMYYDGTDYHAIVKNLAGPLTADTTIYAGAFYAVSIPGTQIEYVAYQEDALSATVSEEQITEVDFTLEVSTTFEEDPIAFNPKYVTSDAVYYGAQTLSHYDAKDPLSHAVSYLKFNGEYALYAYAIGPVAGTEYTLTAHYTDGDDIVTATYTYQMNESGYVEINLAEDFKNDSAEVVDLTADGITVIYFDIAGTEDGTEKVALEALTLNI